jgi:REP element-mobilizing transposase RayT
VTLPVAHIPGSLRDVVDSRMRSWLLSNTTYGTWLPGDERGSVTSVRDRRPGEAVGPSRLEHDLPGEPWEEPIAGLNRCARELMRGPPIYLTLPQAEALLDQLQETASHRGWTLRAVAIMANHFHIVVQVEGDPSPKKILADFKAYATRTLSERFGSPASETWWTTKGSKRKLPNDQAVNAAIHYVLYKQEYPLVVWSPETGRIV